MGCDYAAETRRLLLDEIKRVAEGVALAHNAPRPPEVKVSEKDLTAATYVAHSEGYKLMPPLTESEE